MIKKNTETQSGEVPKFMTRIQNSVKIVDMDTLIDCSAGLAKRIKRSTSSEVTHRLVNIKEEIDWLINNL